MYVFERHADSWSETERLRSSEGLGVEGFGVDVALSGTSALVGTKSGAAYAFERETDGWHEAERLVPPDNDARQFGSQVVLEGGTALVGAYNDSGNVAPYAFVRGASGWQDQQRLVPEASAGNELVLKLALSGDTALVAVQHDHRVYVFLREDGAWNEQQPVLDPGQNERFAGAVAISGDAAFVAAFENAEAGNAQGKV